MYTPGTAPNNTYPGACAGTPAGGSWPPAGAADGGDAAFNTVPNVFATTSYGTYSNIQKYPYGNTSTCIINAPSCVPGKCTPTAAGVTGNQTNIKGINSGSMSIPAGQPNSGCLGAMGSAATCTAASCTIGSTTVCSYNATSGVTTYPKGVNYVPAAVTFTGVVFYTSSNTHTYLMDPFYPFASSAFMPHPPGDCHHG